MRAYTLLMPLISEKPAVAINFLPADTITLPSASFMLTWDSNYLLNPSMKLTSSCRGCSINILNSRGPGRASKMHSADYCTLSTPLMERQCLNNSTLDGFGSWRGGWIIFCWFCSPLKFFVCLSLTLRLLIVFTNSYKSASCSLLDLLTDCFCWGFSSSC